MKTVIKVKVLSENVVLPKVIEKGDWVDLMVAEDVKLPAPQAKTLKGGKDNKHRDVIMEVKYLPLGIAMKLPKGYEAVMVSRSSTPKKLGVIQANCLAVIDNSYSGNNDQWHFPALPIRETELKAGTRICQFRVQLSQKATIWQKIKWLFNSGIEIKKVDSLDDNNRGGLGSTGQKKL